MDVSNTSAPPLSGDPIPPITTDPDLDPESPPVGRVRIFALFWVGLGTLVALTIAGAVGQMFGLQSIETYSQLRGQLVAVEAEHNRLTKENKSLTSTSVTLRAQRQKAEEEFMQVESRLGQIKTQETLALESLANAQTRLIELQVQQKRESFARDAAIKAKDAANAEIAKLDTRIASLTTQKTTLEEAVKPLVSARASLEQTLIDLKAETEALADLSAQAGTKRKAVADLSQQAAQLGEQIKVLQARRVGIGELKDDIALLQANWTQATDDLALLDKRTADEEKRAAKVQANLQAASAEFLATKAETEKLKVTLADLQAELDKKNGQNDAFTKSVSQAGKDLAALQVELKTGKEDRETNQLAVAVLVANLETQRKQFEELQRTTASLEATKARAAEQQKEVARLDALVAQRKQEIANLASRDDEQLVKDPSLRDVLEALRSAIDAAKNADGASPPTKKDDSDPGNGGSGD